MKQFKAMVKVARERGVGSAYSPKSDPYSEAEFFRAVEQCEVFVYADEGLPEFDAIPEHDEHQPLDAPFPVFSIERAGRPLATLTTPSGKTRILDCLMVAELSGAQLAADAKMRSEGWVESSATMVVYVLIRSLEGHDQTFHHVMMFRVSEDHNARFYDLVRTYIDRLGAEKDGVETTDDVVMIPSGKGGKKKRPHQIRRVFHIVPKSAAKHYSTGSGRAVDWSHRFSVRGHWVKLAKPGSIGKNRAGEYVERGRTWRLEHERGPDDKPLIKKQRLVTS